MGETSPLEEASVDSEAAKLESLNRLKQRTMEGRIPEGTESTYDEPVHPSKQLSYNLEEVDRVDPSLATPEADEYNGAPAVEATLVNEEFNQDYFEATYDLRMPREFQEEVPFYANLESDIIEDLLEKGEEDLNVGVDMVENGLIATFEYDNPESASEAVYTVNQAIAPLDSLAESEEDYLFE